MNIIPQINVGFREPHIKQGRDDYMNKKKRIILAKAGLDGHDRGINVIKNFLIEQGHEVFYFGLYKDLDDIAEIAMQEGVDFIGLSIHSAAHISYVERVFNYLKKKNSLDIGIVAGGVIPKKDKKILKDRFGVEDVFVSGTPDADLSYVGEFFKNSAGRTEKLTTNFDKVKAKKDAGLLISGAANGHAGIIPAGSSLNISYNIGITGPLGAGKSTLIDKMILELRRLGKKVGVITIDPSDPISGGAFLGRDRSQMARHLYDENVLIYSMATRGCGGGVAGELPAAMTVMELAGCKIVIVETIGVGQDQVAIKNIVDKTVLVLTPDVGEDQVNKSGIMQIADCYVINKADLVNADNLKRAINDMLDSEECCKKSKCRPGVIKTIAKKDPDPGIKELVEFLVGRKKEKKS